MKRYSLYTVLVTGGCGFIGSHLVKALIDEGAKVLIADDLFTGNQSNLLGVKDYKLYITSVCNTDSIYKIISEVDIIFHLAARNIIASTQDPRQDFDTNIGGTLNVLMAAQKYNVERVVYTSSASVYGNPRYLPINEDDSINLLTPYAVSKYSGEGYCMAFHENYGLSVAVLRLSNVYGPHQSISNPYCGVVARFMDAANKADKIKIHGDGLQTRDFTFVGDAVEALLLAGLSPHADGEVFNVATGIETSVVELAKQVISIAAPAYDATLLYNHKTDRYPEIEHIDRRDIDNIRRRVLNIEKIRRKLGWTPSVTLIEGLRRTRETTVYA